jgi:hypothetical protein
MGKKMPLVACLFGSLALPTLGAARPDGRAEPRPDDGAAVNERAANTTLRSKLQYVIADWHTGEVLFTCDKLPEAVCKCWSISYGVTLDGKLYQLNVGHEKALRDQAKKFVGLPVVAVGTLERDVLTVASLKRAE